MPKSTNMFNIMLLVFTKTYLKEMVVCLLFMVILQMLSLFVKGKTIINWDLTMITVHSFPKEMFPKISNMESAS